MWKAIIKLIEKWGCMHDYEFETKTVVSDDMGQSYNVYLYKCEKCGKFKKVKTH